MSIPLEAGEGIVSSAAGQGLRARQPFPGDERIVRGIRPSLSVTRSPAVRCGVLDDVQVRQDGSGTVKVASDPELAEIVRKSNPAPPTTSVQLAAAGLAGRLVQAQESPQSVGPRWTPNWSRSTWNTPATGQHVCVEGSGRGGRSIGRNSSVSNPALPSSDFAGNDGGCERGDGVVAAAAVDRVQARARQEHVVAAEAVEHVVACIADQGVAVFVAGEVHRGRAFDGLEDLDFHTESERVTGLGDDTVGAFAIGLGHHVGRVVDEEEVVARSAAEVVDAQPAVDPVVAASAAQDVVARPPLKLVPSGSALDQVGFEPAPAQDVVAVAAIEPVGTGAPFDEVVAATAIHYVVAAVAPNVVIAVPPVRMVGARSAQERIFGTRRPTRGWSRSRRPRADPLDVGDHAAWSPAGRS